MLHEFRIETAIHVHRANEITDRLCEIKVPTGDWDISFTLFATYNTIRKYFNLANNSDAGENYRPEGFLQIYFTD